MVWRVVASQTRPPSQSGEPVPWRSSAWGRRSIRDSGRRPSPAAGGVEDQAMHAIAHVHSFYLALNSGRSRRSVLTTKRAGVRRPPRAGHPTQLLPLPSLISQVQAIECGVSVTLGSRSMLEVCGSSSNTSRPAARIPPDSRAAMVSLKLPIANEIRGHVAARHALLVARSSADHARACLPEDHLGRWLASRGHRGLPRLANGKDVDGRRRDA